MRVAYPGVKSAADACLRRGVWGGDDGIGEVLEVLYVGERHENVGEVAAVPRGEPRKTDCAASESVDSSPDSNSTLSGSSSSSMATPSTSASSVFLGKEKMRGGEGEAWGKTCSSTEEESSRGMKSAMGAGAGWGGGEELRPGCARGLGARAGAGMKRGKGLAGGKKAVHPCWVWPTRQHRRHLTGSRQS